MVCRMRSTSSFALVFMVVLLAACGSTPPPDANTADKAQTKTAETSATTPTNPSGSVSEAISSVIGAADRSDEDKALDAGRHPGEILTFFGISPGMNVADLAAGFGYTTELLARTVGPNGKVYGQNNKFILEKFAEQGWTARLAKPINKTVIRVDREFDEPLPPEVHDLDEIGRAHV